MEEYIRLQEEKALSRGETFNWQTTTYDKMEYCEDKDDCLTNFECEFPAVVLDDTSREAFSWEPIVSPLNDNKIDFRISVDESDDEDYTVIYDENSFSYKIIFVDNLKTDSENDNDKIDIKQPSRDMSVIPIPDVINVNAQGSNKISETSHDTSNKFFKTKTFIKKLNVNIMACNYLNNGMLIKNLYVPFGIQFDPKLFYKDGIKLVKVELNDRLKQKCFPGDNPIILIVFRI
ncbi:hypothetical protein Tco_0699514 [Tanacetum coccineum]